MKVLKGNMNNAYKCLVKMLDYVIIEMKEEKLEIKVCNETENEYTIIEIDESLREIIICE